MKADCGRIPQGSTQRWQTADWAADGDSGGKKRRYRSAGGRTASEIALEQPQLCDECRAEVKETGFEDAVLAQLFDRLCELGTAYTTDKLNNVLDDAAQTALARILAHQLPEGDMDKLMQDCFRQMRRLRLEKEYEKHRLLADEYERSADERFLSELMESQRIKNEIKKLYGNQNK